MRCSSVVPRTAKTPASVKPRPLPGSTTCHQPVVGRASHSGAVDHAELRQLSYLVAVGRWSPRTGGHPGQRSHSGTADTPWVERLVRAAPDADSALRQLRERQPMQRLVSAQEVAEAIVYLSSPLASATTGTILAVDGGMAGVRLPT